MRYEPLVGEKFGDYVVIDETIEKSKDSKRMFHVRCVCGKEEYKKAGHLKAGRTKSCKSCSAKKTAKNHPPPINFQGVGGLSRTHYSAIKSGAIRRGIEFDLDITFLWNLYLEQDAKCALTGVPLVLEPSIKSCNVNWDIISASLDRKDSSKGYTIDNVWWVHKVVNRLKNNYNLQELIFWCKLIVDTHGNPDPSVLNDMQYVSTKEQRLGGEESTNNPPKSARHPAECGMMI